MRPNANTEKKKKNSLKDSGLKHLKKICQSYININSVRNKAEALSELVCTPVDIFAINLPGFRSHYKKDIFARSGGILVYVNGDVSSRMRSIRDCPSGIQILSAEMNLKK